MKGKNPVGMAAIYVFGFWWLFFTAREFNWSPIQLVQNWDYATYSVGYWLAGIVGGFCVGIWVIWFQRTQALGRLFRGKGGNFFNGAVSTLGQVPMPDKPSRRISNAKQRLPIESVLVNKWLEESAEAYPAHAKLFMTVWDTYCAYPGHPATHRHGGHANRRLYQHCLAVTEMALQEAGAFVYDGVHTKKRGKTRRQIIPKRNADFKFNPDDPLIPVIALAHDFGKLEAYKFDETGQLVTKESGASTDHDDDRIFHDALGARMLARLPEYWELSAWDRRALNLVIGHYHHPSAFPVDANGLPLDDRMLSLMEFLIYVDKKTGLMESGKTAEEEDNEISEEQSAQIYQAFVQIITEWGRVNGTGDQNANASIKIAQKHDGVIVVKELELRKLILSRLGWSLDEGESRYRVTMNLLYTLAEKGLLHDRHNGVDFSRYHPMYSVSFRSSKNGQHLSTWEPVIIFRPLSTTPEFAGITSLPDFGSRLVINRPLYTHNPGIRDPEVLRELVSKAFGEDVARSIRVGDKKETKAAAEARESQRQATSAALPAPAPSSPDSATRKQLPAASSQPVAGAKENQPASSPSQNATTVVKAPWEEEPRSQATPSQSAQPSAASSEPDGDDADVDLANLPDPNAAGSAESGPADPLDDMDVSISGSEGGDVFSGDDFGSFSDFDGGSSSSETSAPGAAESVAAVPAATDPEVVCAPRPTPTITGDDIGVKEIKGRALPDEDAQRPRTDKRQREKDAARLDALSQAVQAYEPPPPAKTSAAKPPQPALPQTFAKPAVQDRKSSRRKGTPYDEVLGRLKTLIASGGVQVCGNANGFNYVAAEDIQTIASKIDLTGDLRLDDMVKTLKLSVMNGGGITMIGIPE